MLELQLFDNTFSHEEYTVPQKVSENVKWIRDVSNFDYNKPTIFSHSYMAYGLRNQFKNKIGLIFESQAIVPYLYSGLEQFIPEYKLVFTHSSELLKKYKNTRWIPGGGIWVGGKVNETLLGGSGGEIKVYNKTKNISIVSSDKTMCLLHQLRIVLTKHLIREPNYNVDVFGTVNGKWVPIIDSLRDYRFSIVIENFIDYNYYTEKLLNCFATGTIPIYVGAQNLQPFNNNGIIKVEPDINKIIDKIIEINKNPKELYESKLDAINFNLKIASQHPTIEDYIYDRYRFEITNE